MSKRKAEIERLEQALAYWRGEYVRVGWELSEAKAEIERLKVDVYVPLTPLASDPRTA